MAEENDSNSNSATEKSTSNIPDQEQEPGTESVHESEKTSEAQQSNNEVELIDLSNDDEDEDDRNEEDNDEDDDDDDEDEEEESKTNLDQGESMEASNSIGDKEMENGGMESNQNDCIIMNDEDDDQDEEEDDDQEEDDDDDDNDEELIDLNGTNGQIPQTQQRQSIPDEIMISDDDDEDEEDDDDDEEEEVEDQDDDSLIAIEPNNVENNKKCDEISISNDNSNSMSNNASSQHVKNDNDQTSESVDMTSTETKKPSAPSSSANNSNKTNNVKEEIIIDDDDDVVQDLSTKNSNNNSNKSNNNQQQQQSTTVNSNPVAPNLVDLMPKLSEELTGFPKYFKDVITLGECIAINKKYRSDIDIDKDYSILDCPSQVVPLIIKKSNKFPPKLKLDKEEKSNAKPLNPPTIPNQNSKNMLTISDFYSSSVGKFLIGIGLSRVKQWYHKDAINKVRKQIRKEGEAEDLMEELKKQQEYLNSCRMANSSYIYPTIKCEHCDFRSEFKSIINHHMAFPHTTSRKEYKCNYCQFSTRDGKIIIDHVNIMHEKKCMIELPPQLYECPICPYESGVKSKAATHIAKCLKFFVPDKFLINKDDYFPTITPKPITQEDIKIYEATLQALRYAALTPGTTKTIPQIAGLPPALQHQMYMVQQQHNRAPSRTKKQNFDAQAQKAPRQPTVTPAPPVAQNSFNLNQMNMKNVPTPQLYQMLSNAPGAQIINPAAQFAGLPTNALSLINKPPLLPRINFPKTATTTITPQRTNSILPSNNFLINNKPNIISKSTNNINFQNRSDVNSPKGSFVMCEICDGYIKDLEQLRTHMHWIHKVRIHPKMLASRPPLNCQKCQWRFFTDQGLERHLLGAHGLVTSNMQDMVNQNQDGGRCTICGRNFSSKLVTHMSQAHKISLKPAHLSYKCTVCSATFNLYRLFENHVYMVHSGSVKRNNAAQDDGTGTGQPPRKKPAMDIPAANGN